MDINMKTPAVNPEQAAEAICWQLGIEVIGEIPSHITAKIFKRVVELLKTSNLVSLNTVKQPPPEYKTIWKEFARLKEVRSKDFEHFVKDMCENLSSIIYKDFCRNESTEDLKLYIKGTTTDGILRKSIVISADLVKFYLLKKLEIYSEKEYRHRLQDKLMGVGLRGLGPEVFDSLSEDTEQWWTDKFLQRVNKVLSTKNIVPMQPVDSNQVTQKPSQAVVTPVLPRTIPQNSVVNCDENEINHDSQQTTASARITNPPDTSSKWHYKPIPGNEPDAHLESDARQLTTSCGMLVGARVRGKKSKHQGNNGDDWFEMAVTGKWTIIAVSDGAGSKRFSRVGARASCQKAVEYLEEKLANINLSQRTNWEKTTFEREQESKEFIEPDISELEKFLHGAVKTGYNAVVTAYDERKNDPHYLEILGRPLEFNDLSATFLIAIHIPVVFKSYTYDFIMSCQVGDGMIAVVNTNGKATLLAVPDSGEFSGETDFLTSQNKIQWDSLVSRTFCYFGFMKVLMVMTDGVSDDYFPEALRMPELYGDLVSNEILTLEDVWESRIEESLEKNEMTLHQIKNTDYPAPSERITPTGISRPFIRSLKVFSEQIQVPIPTIIVDPALMRAALMGNRSHCLLSEDNVKEPAERLKIWLDSYYVKGSFDDRTLVVLQRGSQDCGQDFPYLNLKEVEA
jgi:serine/threonine protein phosphatase PrpC